MKNQDKTLIIGSRGQLAREFIRVLSEQKYSFVAPDEAVLDIANFSQLENVIKKEAPAIIINCSAYNHVDQAEVNQEAAFRVNHLAVENLAKVCLMNKIFLVHFSSDYVFDGLRNTPLNEHDRVNPLNVYGSSKLKGEQAIQTILNRYLIFRLSWVFGEGQANFLYKLDEWSQNQEVLKIALDEISAPTYTEDVVKITLAALEKDLMGLYHLTNTGFCSRYEWAKKYFEIKGVQKRIEPVSMTTFHLKARRPAYSAMDNLKISKALGVQIPKWEDALERFVARKTGNSLFGSPVPQSPVSSRSSGTLETAEQQTGALGHWGSGELVKNLVSVIIPTYNNSAYVTQAIDSVLAQTYPHIEVIVVDDGSTDKTLEVLEPYMDRIKYFYKENGGPASARNLGIKKASGEFIAFLDGDDVWLAEKLKKQIKVFEQRQDVGLVACHEQEMGLSGDLHGECRHVNYENKRKFLLEMLMGNRVGGGSSSVVRKECLEKVGGFDETLFGTEDWDMWLRIAMHYEVYFVDEILMMARIRLDSVSGLNNIERMLINEIKLLNKTFSMECFKFYFIQKWKSYSLRYLSASRAFYRLKDMKTARKYILKAVGQFPPILFHKERFKSFLLILYKSMFK